MLKKMKYTNFSLRFPPGTNPLEFGYRIKDELTRIGIYPKHVSVSDDYLYFLLEDLSSTQEVELDKMIRKYSQSHLRLVRCG